MRRDASVGHVTGQHVAVRVVNEMAVDVWTGRPSVILTLSALEHHADLPHRRCSSLRHLIILNPRGVNELTGRVVAMFSKSRFSLRLCIKR